MASRSASPPPELAHQGLVTMLRAQKADLPYIPFGRPGAAAVAQLESQARLDPTWLDKRLRELCPGGYDVAVFDTPSARSPLTAQALSMATAAVVVLEPCALSYATLPEVESHIEESIKPHYRGTTYIVNRLDGRRPLSRDVRSALAQSVGDQLSDIAFLDDEHVREATASRTTCVTLSPHAQFTSATRQLANRLLEVLR